MKKITIVALVISLFVLSSCNSYTLPTGANNVPLPPITVTVTQVQSQPVLSPITTTKVINMNDITFAYPAKLCIPSVRAGHPINFRIQGHNGGDADADYDIYFIIPTGMSTTDVTDLPQAYKFPYSPAPSNLGDYLTFNFVQTIKAKWTDNVDVTLNIPDGMILPDYWYFYLAIREKTGGNALSANASTIFVNMQ